MSRFDNLPPEVMQAMCTPMHLILPASPQQRTGALFLGSFSAILDPALLSSNNIAALVQVLDAPWLPSVEAHAAQGNKLECYRLDILDSTSADLRPHLEATVRWIDERLRRGINILVHCQQVRTLTLLLLPPQNASLTRRASPFRFRCLRVPQGVSRSAAVVIAYLIYTHNMTYDAAFDLVRRKRPCIKPNSGFVRCLQDWERQWRLAPNRPGVRRANTTPT